MQVGCSSQGVDERQAFDIRLQQTALQFGQVWRRDLRQAIVHGLDSVGRGEHRITPLYCLNRNLDVTGPILALSV